MIPSEVIVAAITAVIVTLVGWTGKMLVSYLRGEGRTELRRVELDETGEFQDRLMRRINDAEEDLDAAYKRVRNCERRARLAEEESSRLRSEIAEIQRRCERLEYENEVLKQERRENW